jgi:hypothetical protein
MDSKGEVHAENRPSEVGRQESVSFPRIHTYIPKDKATTNSEFEVNMTTKQ